MTRRCLDCAAPVGGQHDASCLIRGPVEPHHTRAAPEGAQEAGRPHTGDVKPIFAEDFSLLTQWWDSNRSRFRSINSRRSTPDLLH